MYDETTASPCRGGGVDGTPLAVSLLVELELRGKDERVGRDEKNTKIPNFRKKWSRDL